MKYRTIKSPANPGSVSLRDARTSVRTVQALRSAKTGRFVRGNTKLAATTVIVERLKKTSGKKTSGKKTSGSKNRASSGKKTAHKR
jgi:hypothetical protein